MDKKLQNKLDKRREEGTLRSLSSFEGMIDFLSNDYLGLSCMQIDERDNYNGSTGSRLISGNRNEIEEVEQLLAEFFYFGSGLFFNSGYDANLGIFSSIAQKGDVVLYDEHIHASVRDGLRLSLANSVSFKHNDIKDLERLLIRFQGKTVYIAVEGIYSMHGDIAPLELIEPLIREYNARLIVDEAHSSGVVGEQGRGVVCDSSSVYIKLVTFGKAYGAHGAIVLTDPDTREYLINFARSFIYTTALPISSYSRLKSIVFHNDLEMLRSRLKTNIDLFRSCVKNIDLISNERSPIQIIRMNSIDELQMVAEELLKAGIAAKIMLPPTVPVGEECLRICVHAFNTPSDIKRLASIISR